MEKNRLVDVFLGIMVERGILAFYQWKNEEINWKVFS